MSFPDYNEPSAGHPKFNKIPLTSEQVQANAKMEALRARRLIEDLVNPDIGREKHEPNVVMPSGAVAVAKGIAISDVTKVALVGTFTTGKGFVIARLAPGGGWSAPLWYKVHAAGVGASIGFSEVHTVLCLPAADAALKFVSKDLHWGSDLAVANYNAATGTVQSAIGSGVRDVSVGEDDAVAFSISSGGIVDLSVQGWKTSPDVAKNAAMYGSAVTPADILGGVVPPLEEFADLYAKLKEVGDSART